MLRLHFTPAAEADLEAIWAYSLDNWGEHQAVTYVEGFRNVLDRQRSGQDFSRNADHIRQGYRVITCGSHLIYFRQTSDVVIVVRILHQRMDPDRHL